MGSMKFFEISTLALGLVISGSAGAQATRPVTAKAAPATKTPAAVHPAGLEPVEVITPIFHQLVAFASPANMVQHVSEHADAKFYLRESVRDVDTLEQWGQKITLTGEKGTAQFQATAAKSLADKLVNGFQDACPNVFAYKDIGALAMGTTPAYLLLVGCGSVTDKFGKVGATHSETSLIVVLQGDQDMYTIQWAERSTPVEKPPVFNDLKWQRRFQQLQPIRICPIHPGEKAPYASCLGPQVKVQPQP